MEKKKNVPKKTNASNKKVTKKVEPSKNNIIMKILVFLGVVILCGVIIYLMNYFFVEKSYIKINISTDKKLNYITLAGKEQLITTQKYVSDLEYSMRYDVDNFTVFKYKNQDIYKLLNDEKNLIVIEKSLLPDSCTSGVLDMEYNNCYVKVDSYTEEHYISTNGKTYKITVKNSNNLKTSDIKERMNYMLNSFEMIL